MHQEYLIQTQGESFVLFDTPVSSTTALVQKEWDAPINQIFFKACEQLPKPKIVLDIGAHVGMFSVLMAKKYPEARVIAIEAVKGTYANLLKSIEANKLPIEAHNKIIWKDKEIKSLLMAPDNTGSASIGNYAHCVAVETGEPVNLNELFESLGLDKEVDSVVMKMDIERAEFEILPNFKYWDAINKFLLEVHWPNLPPNPDGVAHSLNLLSFVCQKLGPHKVFASMPLDVGFHGGAFYPLDNYVK